MIISLKLIDLDSLIINNLCAITHQIKYSTILRLVARVGTEMIEISNRISAIGTKRFQQTRKDQQKY